MVLNNRKKLFSEYFDSIYASSNTLVPQEYDKTTHEFQFYYGNFLPNDKDVSILDIGCGAGHFLYYLKKMGYKNMRGIDISSDQIDFCKNNVTSDVELADAFEFLPNKINVYGAISANDVIEHIPKEKVVTFIELIHQALKPDGVFLFKIPNMSNPFALDLRYRDFTHECGFTNKSIYQVLYIAGFRDIRIYPSQYYGKSAKSYLMRILVSLVHRFIKKMFWYQGFTAPEILSSRLIVIARK